MMGRDESSHLPTPRLNEPRNLLKTGQSPLRNFTLPGHLRTYLSRRGPRIPEAGEPAEPPPTLPPQRGNKRRESEAGILRRVRVSGGIPSCE